jgi:hypothetical protein
LLQKVRRARLGRNYRRIAKLELRMGLADPVVGDSRLTFASETMAMLDRGLIAQHVPRQARRQMQRALVAGKA